MFHGGDMIVDVDLEGVRDKEYIVPGGRRCFASFVPPWQEIKVR